MGCPYKSTIMNHILRYPESGHIHPYPTGEDIIDPLMEPFRVWVPENPILVLGYSQEPEREFNMDVAHKNNTPIYKRKGGGGAVLLTSGNVCVALRFKRKPGFGIKEYFDAANGAIQSILHRELKIDLKPRGISDLALHDRKVLGCSLYLPRGHAIYLASILVDSDLHLMDRFLRYPTHEPDYRRGRSHGEFIQNLAGIPGMESLTSEDVCRILNAELSDPENIELDWP